MTAAGGARISRPPRPPTPRPLRQADRVPEPPPAIGFAPITPTPFASLWDNLPRPKRVDRPQENERLFGQNHGMVLYRNRIRGGGTLAIDGVGDYQLVFKGGRFVEYVSRVQPPSLPSNPAISLCLICIGSRRRRSPARLRSA